MSLIEAAGDGRPVQFASTRPELAASPLPADILREALLDPSLRADPRGLTIVGATITGFLDLSFATLDFPLNFLMCSFEQTPNFQYFCGTHLSLKGCRVPGINLDAAVLDGRLSLNDGFESHGSVTATGITVRDTLNCSGATLDGG